MLNAKARAARVANLHPSHQAVNTILAPTGKTVAQVAAAAGISQTEAEHRLQVLVDESLATRTRGDRATALYVTQ
jgi:hypothetical protein